ncbi:hypothetical protein IFM89_031264 [Coptis chinensis]|uniref:Uncharacterized protein n=1 Tax=Coptis chinensis TaxID=261450 RepID=A0A835MDX7_9MAGN|nr:hypothetical protein IFM89_031264 [Coptis chinensis]
METETMMFESNHCGRSLYPRFMSVSSKDLITSSTDHDIDAIKAEKRLIDLIVKDEKDKFVNQSKNLFQVISNEQNLENTETEVIDRRFALRLLFLACHIDSVECAEALLVGKIGLGVQVNEYDEFGKTALHCAAEMHSKRCIDLLLRYSARTDLRSTDDSEELPIEMALSSKRMITWSSDETIDDLLVKFSKMDLSAVRLLAENTDDIAEVAYLSSMEGEVVSLAALLMVVPEKVTATIMVLRPDGGLASKDMTTIYECAIREALCLGQKEGSFKVSRRRLGLMSRTQKRNLLLIEIELLQLFDASFLQRPDRRVTSPLVLAAQACDEEVVKLLLSTNIDVNETDREGNSALHCYLKHCSNTKIPRIPLLLLKHGANVSQKNKLGLTPLHLAASSGYFQALQILLLKDPDCIDAVSEMNETSLFFAVKNDFLNCAQLLLRSGANKQILNLRLSPKAKTEICKYFESPRGCARGANCLYAHGEAELKQGMQISCFPTTEELKRKIFIGGLPVSFDSEMLGEFFEENFGSVVDAVVMRSQVGEQEQSRGFGFVTFKNEKSVAAAVQQHYVKIWGKKVEIKEAVQQPILTTKSPASSPRQQHHSHGELQIADLSESYGAERRHEPLSLVESLLHGKPRSAPHVKIDITLQDQKLPSWLTTFKKWFPGFLNNASCIEKGMWYPLSSLKGDFRTTCGLELDHASIGYVRLSDFIRSIPDICRMKVVPVNQHNPASHMVLFPNCRTSPKHYECLQLTESLECAGSPSGEQNEDDDDDFRCISDLIASTVFGNFKQAGSGEGTSSSSAQDNKRTEKGKSIVPQPNPWSLISGNRGSSSDKQPQLQDEGGGGGKGDDNEITNQELLKVLLGGGFSLFDRSHFFYHDYRKCLEKSLCFRCKKNRILWASHPCGHLLWCTPCKTSICRQEPKIEFCMYCAGELEKYTVKWSTDGEHSPADDFPTWDLEVASTIPK